MSSKKQKRRKKGGNSWMILFLVALVVLIFSLTNLVRIFLSYKAGTDEYDGLRQYTTEASSADAGEEDEAADSDSEEQPEESGDSLSSVEIVPPPITVDFASLQGINPDVKGWLYVEAMDISYPIVQGADNNEYLHTTYEGNSNSAGSIFIDYQNSGDFSDCNTIVYGHNMKNQSMFGKLKFFKEQEKYKDSVYFWILTPEHNYRYQAFAAFYTEAVSDVYTLFSDGGDLLTEYLEKMSSKTEVPLDKPEFTAESKIVTLSTCAGRNSTRRFVIQGIRLDQ